MDVSALSFVPAKWSDTAARHVALIEPDAETLDVVADRCISGAWSVMALFRQNTRVGTIVFDIERHPSGALHLVVKYAFAMGGGATEQIAGFAEKLARELGCKKLRFWTSRKAERLAEKHGFKLFYVMEKDV